MSILRFMMLSYLICNFDRIVVRFFFLVIYAYISSVSFVVLHDGWSGFFLFKAPVNLYVRVYSIFKWYYYNREMLSFGRGLKIFLVMGGTFALQYSVWNLEWKRVPVLVLRFCRRCCAYSIKPGRVVLKKVRMRTNANGVDSVRSKMVNAVDEILQDIWGTVSTSEKDKMSRDDLASLKKAFLIKVSYQIDEFIQSALELRDRK
ncbi:hypothetical protein ACIS_00111 [Anaplasma centrale str. Israel]|uniref:Uncharacterized protein n=1 Tax=Anaplasma centrale (strain Israel) TaxID=574556 RepID=D1ATD7_ANACI|nr:hypothetical protein [Anaplasma centrale]ACZ48815.1 hypothetical protein ACIS_00111 [Anaplasma centrale str. Israel]